MSGRRDVQKPYAFLPRLPEAAALPGFEQKYPNVGRIWFADAEELERRLPPARQKLLERAAQQAAEATEVQPAGRAPSSPSSTGAEQVLDFLSAWLQNGREDLCQEFERQLKESYTWPPAERRKMVEVHRQKWKALEAALLQLMEAMRRSEVPSNKAEATMSRLRPARHAALKVQVKTLRQVKQQLWPDPGARDPVHGVPTDAEVDAWLDPPADLPPKLLEAPSSDEEPSQRVEMETQTPADIAVDAVPLSLSERPFPQGLPSKMEMLDVPMPEEVPEGLDHDLGEVFAGMDANERAAFATILQEQDELAEQKAESERALKQQELKLKEKDKAFQDELRQKEKEHQAILQSERDRFAQERYRLRTKLMGEELAIETRKLKDELIRLRRVRPMRKNAQKVLWWTEEDVNHVIAGKQLVIRRAGGATSKTEAMCALAIGTARDWLFRSRELIESKSFAPNGSSISGAATKAEQSEVKLKLHFAKTTETIGHFKAAQQRSMEQLSPDSTRSPTSRLPRVEQIQQGLGIELEMAKGARDAVTERLRDAEAKLDQLAEEDLAADFLTRWSEQISAVSLKGMQTQRQTKDLAERIEGALRKEASKYRSVAQAAYADIAADRAAETALKRAEEAQKRQEAREAARKKDVQEAVRREQDKKTKEQQKMVPVKLRMSGLRSTAIDDKGKFGQVAEQKLAKALNLKESQVRVTGIK
ncbi:unnamed protein product [Durusdinium trenchii]|uniref:Uncharacterized protein n=2 Tax=Durusdinium trenchii TaxID=1381693 RepID=A0ABP0SKX1_9DINO